MLGKVYERGENGGNGGIKVSLFSNMLIKFSFPADGFKFQELGKAFPYLIVSDQFALASLVCDSLDAC